MIEYVFFNERPTLVRNFFSNILFQITLLWIIFFALVFFFFYLFKSLKLYLRLQKLKREKKLIIENVKKYNLKQLKQLEWKDFIKKLINLIENFDYYGAYKGVDDILNTLRVDKKEKEIILEWIYKDKPINNEIVEKLKEKIAY